MQLASCRSIGFTLSLFLSPSQIRRSSYVHAAECISLFLSPSDAQRRYAVSLSLMYSYMGGRAVRLLPIISLFRSLSPSHAQRRYAVSLSHSHGRKYSAQAADSISLSSSVHACVPIVSLSLARLYVWLLRGRRTARFSRCCASRVLLVY